MNDFDLDEDTPIMIVPPLWWKDDELLAAVKLAQAEGALVAEVIPVEASEYAVDLIPDAVFSDQAMPLNLRAAVLLGWMDSVDEIADFGDWVAAAPERQLIFSLALSLLDELVNREE